ncbi:deoxyribonuclease IV [Candidatus Oleimmundimicrobium sp.]|uniref:deoxyribonuclease IV n=1 Tax=Candidatus Oleimmundimicrobium sp. TaxID=3060597 RepID=UPI00272682C6|nr:deoxyribonuclease IV [Candidatus Oleimmundimicrobium sp.]MDO8885524.1 deoxyribonuclease IV [Candidatus Oleimmundimicrobium sp.]
MKFGCHVSIVGKIYLAVERAILRGCETMQIFSGNPRGWKRAGILDEDIHEFNFRREDAGIDPLVIHMPYLVNLGSPDADIYSRSARAMLDAIERAKKLKASYLVFHPGSHKGAGTKDGLIRISESLKSLTATLDDNPKILLENTAGSGFNLGAKFEELAFIFEELDWSEKFGVCLDTCHAFAAGYDISTKEGLNDVLRELDEKVGIDRVSLIHANDSCTPLGSRIDRHTDIGKGYIGLGGFKRIVNHPLLRELPCILETPHMSENDDIRNLSLIRSLVE